MSTDGNAKRRAATMALLGCLVRLIRNCKVHKLSNEIFEEPLERMTKAVRLMIEHEGRCHLQIDASNFYLNGTPAQIEVDWRPHLQFLQQAFEDHDIGGFNTDRPVSARQLKGMLVPFAKMGTPIDHPQLLQLLGHIELQPYTVIDEHVKGEQTNLNLTLMRQVNLSEVAEHLDMEDVETGVLALRRVTETYAKAVYFVSRVLHTMESTGPKVPLGMASPIVQELVDCADEEWPSFLSLVVGRPPPKDYEPYHHATTTVLAIALGTRIGMDRISRFELGLSALFHNLAIVDVAELISTSEVLDREKRAVLAQLPQNNARRLLQSRAPDYDGMVRILTAYELKDPLGRRVKRADGTVVAAPVLERPLIYSRIVSVAAHFDALTSPREFRKPMTANKAIDTMRGPMALRFDQAVVEQLRSLLNL